MHILQIYIYIIHTFVTFVCDVRLMCADLHLQNLHFDIQHLKCNFFYFVRRGSQNSKKNDIYNLFQLGLCKKIFLIKAKKYFVLGFPKVL